MIDIDPKLTKIIALARHGIGGEKDNALKLVAQICEREGLDFDDVMSATDYREYMLEIKIKNQLEMDIIAQVCFKFALTEQHQDLKVNKKARVFFYTTTPSKHIETLNAAAIYLNAFRKERKKFESEFTEAFVHKHRIYGEKWGDDAQESDPMTYEKLKKVERMMTLAGGMDNVTVQKTIEGGKRG
jgi:hypothetical protein